MDFYSKMAIIMQDEKYELLYELSLYAKYSNAYGRDIIQTYFAPIQLRNFKRITVLSFSTTASVHKWEVYYYKMAEIILN